MTHKSRGKLRKLCNKRIENWRKDQVDKIHNMNLTPEEEKVKLKEVAEEFHKRQIENQQTNGRVKDLENAEEGKGIIFR